MRKNLSETHSYSCYGNLLSFRFQQDIYKYYGKTTSLREFLEIQATVFVL